MSKHYLLIAAVVLFAVGIAEQVGFFSFAGGDSGIASATYKAHKNHRLRVAKMYSDFAANPPKTVSDWAEASTKAGAELEKIRTKEMAAALEPLLSGKSEDDALDPAVARHVFLEIAKGLRK